MLTNYSEQELQDFIVSGKQSIDNGLGIRNEDAFAMLREPVAQMAWAVLPEPRKRKSSYERSREDIAASRVYEYASLQDFINEIR